jgi:hypothetical protein
MKTIKAWYFSDESKKLRYGDGREIKLGVTHEVDVAPVLCARGLHGSVRILNALEYAPGPIVWRVELSGDMDVGKDKIAATRREYIAGGVNVEHILRRFARKCALDVINLWNAPNVVVQYLKTGDEDLRAAAWEASRAASRAAAGEASRAAARGASRAAAWGAAWGASQAASRAAAGEASRAAAWKAVWVALKEKQNKRLTAMVIQAIKRRV